MDKAEYPLLPQLERIAWQAAKEIFGFDQDNLLFRKCEAEVWLQTWSDTSTGLRTDPHQLAGQMMTEAYTTVMHLTWEDKEPAADNNDSDTLHEIWVVFFNNKPAYTVDEPKQAFFDDLKARHLASILEAKDRY